MATWSWAAWPWRPAPDPRAAADAAFDLVGGPGGLPALVLVLARRLDRPVDIGHALRLAAVAALDEAAAARLGPEPAALWRDLHGGAGDAARFVRALAALDRIGRRTRADVRLWSDADRLNLFDADALARPCAHDRVLAALADRVWRAAAGRLAAAGEDPAALALAALAGAAGPAPSHARTARHPVGIATDCG